MNEINKMMIILTTLTLNDWFYVSIFSGLGGFLGFCSCYAAFQLTQKYNRRKRTKQFDDLYYEDREPMPLETPTTKCSDTLQQQGGALSRAMNCELLSLLDGQQEYYFEVKGNWSQEAIDVAADIFRKNGWPIVEIGKSTAYFGRPIVICKLATILNKGE